MACGHFWESAFANLWQPCWFAKISLTVSVADQRVVCARAGSAERRFSAARSSARTGRRAVKRRARARPVRASGRRGESSRGRRSPGDADLAAGRWPLAAGRWPLAAGRWPLAAGRWPLAAGRWPLAAGRWPLAAGRWPLAAGRWPLAAGRWPLAAGRWPLAAGRWPLIITARVRRRCQAPILVPARNAAPGDRRQTVPVSVCGAAPEGCRLGECRPDVRQVQALGSHRLPRNRGVGWTGEHCPQDYSRPPVR